jgi:hypothetical protein
MNYKHHYDLLISRAKNRDLSGQYVERHHILPRCMGGTDELENIAILTPEEHFVAHLLLAKISNTPNLWYAVLAMSVTSKTHVGCRKNKIYGWAKRRIAIAKSITMSEWHSQNIHPLKGKKHTEKTKAKIKANSNNGTKIFMYDMAGNFMSEFKSVKEASGFVKRAAQTVWAAAKDPRLSAGGYKFSYIKSDVISSAGTSSTRKRFIVNHPEKRGLHLSPWEMLDKKNRKDLASIWAKAPEIILEGSTVKAKNNLGFGNYHITRKILKKAASGWVPGLDESWLSWKTNLEGKI